MDAVTNLAANELGDPGKVLLVLEAAKATNVVVQKELLDTYIFLLKEQRILPFEYFFRFRPLPVSDLLHEDLYNLSQAGFVRSASPIVITDHGLKWLGERVPPGQSETLLNQIGGPLATYSQMTQSELSRTVYAKLTKAIPR